MYIYTYIYIYWRRLRWVIAAPPHKLPPHNPSEISLKFPSCAKWCLPWTQPELAFVSTSEIRSQEDIEYKNVPQDSSRTSKMSPKSIQNTTFSKVGHVCKQGAEKHEKYNFSQSLLEAFFESKKANWFAKRFLPWTIPALASTSTSQERSLGDIWTHKCAPRLPNEFQKESKSMQNMIFY